MQTEKIRQKTKISKDVVRTSPYMYLSDLKEERTDDLILQSISLMCEYYMLDTESVSMTDEEIEAGIDFCEFKIVELSDLLDSFHLKREYKTFTHIGHALDIITHGEVENFSVMSVYVELQSEINSGLNQLYLCLNILNKIKKDLYDN